MGLLDDAIREHLELKRRRGADPEEVAREQREALDAAAGRKAAVAAAGEGTPAVAASGDTAADPVAEADHHASTANDPSGDGTPVQPASAGADETAELDMSSVLGEGDDAESEGAQPAEAEAGAQPHLSTRPVPAHPTEEDSLEWEVTGEAAEDEEQEEDVLEETPDFLRDTPEQDRLWFEQQPPRDFDFDK
jgi:hypothetical protein